ncbi:hypothetical protein [Polyangium fumosum]|uniref:Uncharacterized protein n=1 Tax=Polyangium fumosum TaxID=889272 RepID=A0A4U1JCC0_9BACT|nr:hypothetical protein [Polyangium fumosum]TKD06455.1 hypothetical protein E8A74_19755 [Polyangium fumosum]
MRHHNLASPPRDLLWLRRLFTIFVVLGVYSAARAWRTPDAGGPPFDMLYHLVLLPLMGGACVAAWRGHFRTFVLLAIVDRAISGFGALLYFLRMALPSSMFYSTKHPDYLAWNFLCVALSTTLLIYLSRKYPPDVQALSGRAPIALRVLQGGLLLVAAAIAIDIAPELRRHVTEESPHGHSCSWFLAQALVAVLLGCAFLAGVRKKWSTFVSLGLIGSTLTAFFNFTHLIMDSYQDEAYGTAYDPLYLSRNLPVFAFALFSVVYLARRFPPRITAPSKPSAAGRPSPAAD